jgi:hypothetical protein
MINDFGFFTSVCFLGAQKEVPLSQTLNFRITYKSYTHFLPKKILFQIFIFRYLYFAV